MSTPNSTFVIFDLGNVVALDIPHTQIVYLDLPVSTFSESQKQVIQTVATAEWKQFSLGLVTEHQFWEAVLKELSEEQLSEAHQGLMQNAWDWTPCSYCQSSPSFVQSEEKQLHVIIQYLKRIVREKYIKVCYPTVALAQRLQLRGYNVGLLSNHCKEWFYETLQRFRLFDIFTNKHLNMVSADLGLVKPDKAIFEVMLSRCKETTSSEETTIFFVDDKKRNVEAATQLGINGICFSSCIDDIKSLETKLDSLNVQL